MLSDDPIVQAEADDVARAEEERRARWQRACSDVSGRHLFYELLADLGAFEPVHGDRHAGRHEAALYIVAAIKAAGLPYWLKMIEENET